MHTRNPHARFRTISAGAAILLIGSACGAAEEPIDDWQFDERTETPSPEVMTQLASVRSGATETLDELRTDIEYRRNGADDESLERWSEVATRLEEARGEVLREVDGADPADPDDAARLRDRAAEWVAEVEAEVVRVEVEFAETPAALRERADERIAELEGNLSELRMVVALGAPEADSDAAVTPVGTAQDWTRDEQQHLIRHPFDLDASALRDLEEELAEAREMAMAAATDREDDFDEVREELGDALADLTREIRQHWLALKWSDRGA